MNSVERAIVKRLVEFMLVRGWLTRWQEPGGQAATLDVIEKIEETGMAWIRFARADVKPGSVLLIEGNSEDIVSDWTIPADGAFGADMDAFLTEMDRSVAS